MKPALRRTAIALAAVGALAGTTFWLLGREATLQALVQRVADLSGGNVAVSGVTGSLYGTMHFGQIRLSGESSTVTIDKADVSWSPMQLFSGGIEISSLRAASVKVELRPSKEPTVVPASLAPPFTVSIGDARVDQLEIVNRERHDRLGGVHLSLRGDARQWQLRDASASTQWGQLRANGKVDTANPFKIDAVAELNGRKDLQLHARAGGNLLKLSVEVDGKGYGASGTAGTLLEPFEPAPLRRLTAKLALPARLQLDLNAAADANAVVSGTVKLNNPDQAGPLDRKQVPLRGASAHLGGNLNALQFSDVLIDLADGGTIKGSGSIGGGLAGAQFGLHANAINLKAVHGSLRATHINGKLDLTGNDKAQDLTVNLAQDGLVLTAHAALAGSKLTLERARLQAGNSAIEATAQADLGGPFSIRASLLRLNPAAFGDFPEADINAHANASGTLAGAWKANAEFALDTSRIGKHALSGKGSLQVDARRVSSIQAQLALADNKLELKGAFGAPGDQLQWMVDAQQLALLRPGLTGSIRANGTAMGAMAASAIDIKGAGTASKFEPSSFGLPIKGAINSEFDFTARTGNAWRAGVNVNVLPSTLGNAPLRGFAKLVLEASHLVNADLDMQLGPNVLTARGAFGRSGEQLDWKLDAGQLGVLGPEFGGTLRGNGAIKGMWNAPALIGSIDGKALVLQKHRLASVTASVNVSAESLNVDARLAAYEGTLKLANASLQLRGTPEAHTLKLAASNDSADAVVEARGGWNGSDWNGALTALQNKGSYAMSLQSPAPLKLSVATGAGPMGLLQPEQINLTGLVVALPAGRVNLQALSKQAMRWHTHGNATGVPLRYLAQGLPTVHENFSGDLALGADWALDMQGGSRPSLAGGMHVFRERGDLAVGADVATALGLNKLDVRADFLNSAQANTLRMQLAVDGTHNGAATVDASTELIEGRLSNTSPLTLAANADLRSIAWLAPLLGQSDWEVDGKLKAALRGSGTLGNPALSGSVSGDEMVLRWPDQGVKLRNGQLRAQLSGDQMQLQRLAFDGPQGNAVASGSVRFANGDADVQLKLMADKLELMSRPDRTVVLSGSSTLVRDQKHFQLNGKFRADRARIELAPLDRPTLSDDVLVLGRGGVPPPKPAPSVPLGIDLEADLGDDFALKGMGLDAQMAGIVRIRSENRRPPRAIGNIRVVSGTYFAYGKKLQIERGVLNFTGAYDNPGLNILAVRKQAEGDALSETNVEAGVEVRGTALSPVAKLVSTPNVPDSDKLAWLVLGHGMEGAGGQELGVLSAAAGALLGGSGGGLQSRLANSIGVDELGLAQAKGLESTVVTVGKRLSQRAYLSFEQGASTATSLVKLRYKLNPRITLQFQTGANTALDVLYSWAFD